MSSQQASTIAKYLAIALLSLSFVIQFSVVARATDNSEFQLFLKSLWPSAKANGIRKSTFNAAIKDLTPDPEILNAQRKQPEFISPVWSYVERAVSDKRLELGRDVMTKRAEILDKIEERYGVQRHILLAIWGLESTFGKNTGNKKIIRSLATLAFKGERQKYGRTQLIAALKILQKGDIPLEEFKGSWAGAMGHTQFIPTTYNAYAVDFTGDGTRDIWRSISDALASTANYLKKSGWESGKTWGYEVKLPANFDYRHSGWGKKKQIKNWEKLGITRVNKRHFPRLTDQAELILPAGARGPAFLVLKNFHVILKYNKSVSYVLAIGHLGDRLLGYGKFIQPWPTDEKPLKHAEQKELQQLLSKQGFEVGKIDGKIGQNTKRAVQAFQQKIGLPADGYPNSIVLQHLRRL